MAKGIIYIMTTAVPGLIKIVNTGKPIDEYRKAYQEVHKDD